MVCVVRTEELEKELAVLKEKIHHLDDMLKSQQRKVRHMIEQVRTHTCGCMDARTHAADTHRWMCTERTFTYKHIHTHSYTNTHKPCMCNSHQWGNYIEKEGLEGS